MATRKAVKKKVLAAVDPDNVVGLRFAALRAEAAEQAKTTIRGSLGCTIRGLFLPAGRRVGAGDDRGSLLADGQVARELGRGARVVTVLPEGRDRYLSLEQYTT